MALFGNKSKKFDISRLFVKLKQDEYLMNMKTMSNTITTLVTTMQQMENEYHELVDYTRQLEEKLAKLEASKG